VGGWLVSRGGIELRFERRKTAEAAIERQGRKKLELNRLVHLVVAQFVTYLDL
jgi:hypothetical protein